MTVPLIKQPKWLLRHYQSWRWERGGSAAIVILEHVLFKRNDLKPNNGILQPSFLIGPTAVLAAGILSFGLAIPSMDLPWLDCMFNRRYRKYLRLRLSFPLCSTFKVDGEGSYDRSDFFLSVRQRDMPGRYIPSFLTCSADVPRR